MTSGAHPEIQMHMTRQLMHLVRNFVIITTCIHANVRLESTAKSVAFHVVARLGQTALRQVDPLLVGTCFSTNPKTSISEIGALAGAPQASRSFTYSCSQIGGSQLM